MLPTNDSRVKVQNMDFEWSATRVVWMTIQPRIIARKSIIPSGMYDD
jgi:hypothetical protein